MSSKIAFRWEAFFTFVALKSSSWICFIWLQISRYMNDKKRLNCHLMKIRIVSTCFENHTLLMRKKACNFPTKFARCMFHNVEHKMFHGMDCTDIWGDTWNVYMGKSGIYHSVNWLVHKGFPPHISLSQVSQMPHNKTRQDWSSRKHFWLKTRGILFFFPMVFPWSLCPSSSHQISQVEISAEI